MLRDAFSRMRREALREGWNDHSGSTSCTCVMQSMLEWALNLAALNDPSTGPYDRAVHASAFRLPSSY